MTKTRVELLEELRQLEIRRREIQDEKKRIAGDFRDQINGVTGQIGAVLVELQVSEVANEEK